MGNKNNRLRKKRKNRGYERLTKWRLLKSYELALESYLECSSNSHGSCSSNTTVEVTQLDSKQTIWNEPEDNGKVMDSNTAAVAGVMTTGGGLGVINVRCSMTYDEHHQEVCKCKGWEEELALKQTRTAGEEESAVCDVDHSNNTPLPLLKLKVETDGNWAKRTYSRKNYISLSGAVCIVYHIFFNTRQSSTEAACS